MSRNDGTFVKEFINRRTLGFGSAAFESALSVDAEQRFLYNVDGMNQKVRLQRNGVGHSGEPGAMGSYRPDPRAAPNTFASSYGMVTSS